MTKKNLEYYLSLPYKIEVTQIPESEGGGYMATLPEIGKYAIIGDGDSPEKAIQNLRELKKERFQEFLEERVAIPEPITEDHHSGKFIVRVPKTLHFELAAKAKEEGVSLNQLINYMLSSSNERIQILDEIRKDIFILHKEIKEISYKIVDHSHIRTEENIDLLSLETYFDNNYIYEKAA